MLGGSNTQYSVRPRASPGPQKVGGACELNSDHAEHAPELFQTCVNEDGGTWACGRQAHAFLRGFVSRGTLTCISTSTDRYGRTLATCSARDIADIGDAMVRAGYAVSLMSGIGYWAAEFEARYHRRGIWSGAFDRPQDWRRRHPRSGS